LAATDVPFRAQTRYTAGMPRNARKSPLADAVVERVMLVLALSSIGALLLIAVFMLREGLPFFLRVGLRDFLGSQTWQPQASPPRYGVLPMVVSTLWVTLGALVVGAPLGVAGAIFLCEFVPRSVLRVAKPTIELLAGIPSVVYGFIGVTVLVPWIRMHLGGPGLSMLAGSIILGIMVLPTVMSISVDAIAAVPTSYREGALALGATRWQAVRMVVVKAARRGIVAGIILGMGRAVGETMAVIMVTGNAVKMPTGPLDSVRTLTANIALEMGYAIGVHRQALFATGVVLFVVIMLLNAVVTRMIHRSTRSR
jgi:phosphate ABC transporter permease protein PstC